MRVFISSDLPSRATLTYPLNTVLQSLDASLELSPRTQIQPTGLSEFEDHLKSRLTSKGMNLADSTIRSRLRSIKTLSKRVNLWTDLYREGSERPMEYNPVGSEGLPATVVGTVPICEGPSEAP